jgi:hypothetical protein
MKCKFIAEENMFEGMKTLIELKQKFRQLWPHLNERGTGMVAGEEALQFGFGGISLVSSA